MRKTTCIKEFEKEAIEGTNREHFDAVMEQWQKHWESCLNDLKMQFTVQNALETMKMMDDFNKQKGNIEDRQYVLDHLNKRIRECK